MATGNSVTLDWSAMPTADGYVVYYGASLYALDDTLFVMVEDTAVWEHSCILTTICGHSYQVDADDATPCAARPFSGLLSSRLKAEANLAGFGAYPVVLAMCRCFA